MIIPTKVFGVSNHFRLVIIADINSQSLETRITLSENQAKLITGSSILSLALSIPSAFIVLHRMAGKISCLAESIFTGLKQKYQALNNDSMRVQEQAPEENDSIISMERTPLLSRDRQYKPEVWPHIMLPWRSPNSLYSLIKQSLHFISRNDEPLAWNRYLAFFVRVHLTTISAFLALACFFALAAWAIMSGSNIVSESAVLSDHPDCGLWFRKEEATIFSPSSAGCDYLQEVEAGDYVKKCYHNSPGTDGCNTFFTQSLPYTQRSYSQCPFEDSLCLNGNSSAYTLETGPVSSKALGINVDIGYTFNRITTCSPIQRRVSVSEDGMFYDYEYGNTTGHGNLTWRSPVNTSWEFSGYNVE
jgi:hypothetical protein